MRYNITKFIFILLIFSSFISEASQQQKRKLVIYSHRSFARDWTQAGHPVKNAFESICDCEVELVALESSGTILSRLLLEGKNSQADLAIGLDMSFIDQAENSRLFTTHNVDLSNLSLPVEWDNAYFVPYDYSYLAFVYDSTKLKNPPKSFKELVETPSKDLKIVIQDPRSSSVGLGLLAWTRLLYGDKAEKTWDILGKKIVTITKSWGESYGLFLQGEAHMVLSYSSSPAYHMITEGIYNIQAAKFSEGHYLQIEVIGKLKSSKSPELADQFMNFILSRSFQRVMPINNFMFPVIDLQEDMPKEYTDLARDKFFITTPTIMRKNRNKWVQEWLRALSKK